MEKKEIKLFSTMTYYDLMSEVYLTGDLAQIEGYLRTLDVSLDDVNRDDLVHEMRDLHSDFEDDLGLLRHETLISLASSSPYHCRAVDVIHLLVAHGAPLDDSANLTAALSTSNRTVLECMVGLGITVLPHHVLYAFQRSTVDVLEWLYRIGVRVSRCDRDSLVTLIHARSQAEPATTEQLWKLYQGFTQRSHTKC